MPTTRGNETFFHPLFFTGLKPGYSNGVVVAVVVVVLDAINTAGLPFKGHSVLNSWFSTSTNSSNPASAETIASDFSLT